MRMPSISWWIGLAVLNLCAAGSDWPQPGGPNRNGVVPDSPKLLDAWPKEGPPLLWKSDFVPSYRDGGCSAPIVADGKVFVFSNKQPVDGGDGFKLITKATVELLKSKNYSEEHLAKVAKMLDQSRTTLADWVAELKGVKNIGISHHLYVSPQLRELWEQAFVWSDTMYCLDAETGKTLWKKSFPVDKASLSSQRFGGHGIQWWTFDNLGASGTPTAWNGKVYFAGSAGLYCLSAMDGALLWQVKGGPEHGTPLVAGGIVYLLGVAYDAETGKERWRNPLWQLHDGKHSRDEWVARYFGAGLLEKDGKRYIVTSDGRDAGRLSTVCLELETGKVAWTFKREKSYGFYRVAGDLLLADGEQNAPFSEAHRLGADGPAPEVLWQGRFIPPSLVHDGHGYGGNGILYCANMKTGQITWKTNKFACCPNVLADGKIIGSLDSSGYSETVTVGMIKASPDKYEVLGTFSPEAITMCPVVVAGGKLFVRTKDRMACYDLRDHGVYLGGVDATKESLVFRFQQTGGGLAAPEGLNGVTIALEGQAPAPAKARIDGETLAVDIKDLPGNFTVAGAAGVLKGKNGTPAPAFAWQGARELKFKRAFDRTILLSAGNQTIPQNALWTQSDVYKVEGAQVAAVELDATGRNLKLTTDKTWKPGDAIKIEYPCFKVDRGEPRRAQLAATVAEFQRAEARFLRQDAETSGDWKGKYGKEGALIAGDTNTSEAPKVLSAGFRNSTVDHRWAQKESDPVHLQRTGENRGRSIDEWISADEQFVDVDIADGKEHQVTIYVGSRNAATVEVLDADTGKVLDTRAIEPGNRFTYQVWNVKGSVILHAVNQGSTEAAGVCIGGLFVDPAGK